MQYVPPFGTGYFPPYGVNIVAVLSNGHRFKGRTVHLCDLSPTKFHCVGFLPDSFSQVFFFGSVPEQFGSHPDALVVVGWGNGVE